MMHYIQRPHTASVSSLVVWNTQIKVRDPYKSSTREWNSQQLPWHKNKLPLKKRKTLQVQFRQKPGDSSSQEAASPPKGQEIWRAAPTTNLVCVWNAEQHIFTLKFNRLPIYSGSELYISIFIICISWFTYTGYLFVHAALMSGITVMFTFLFALQIHNYQTAWR